MDVSVIAGVPPPAIFDFRAEKSSAERIQARVPSALVAVAEPRRIGAAGPPGVISTSRALTLTLGRRGRCQRQRGAVSLTSLNFKRVYGLGRSEEHTSELQP